MTSRERVMATIERRPVDRIPVCHIQFSGHAASVILGREAYVGGAFLQWKEMNALWDGPDAHTEFESRCAADAVAIAEACGHDVLRLRYWRWPSTRRPVAKPDERTFVFENADGSTHSMTYLPDVEQFSVGGASRPSTEARGYLSHDELDEMSLRRRVEVEEEAAGDARPAPGPDEALRATYAEHSDYLVRWGGGTPAIGAAATDDLMACALWPDLMARLLAAGARRYAAQVPALAAAGMQVYFGGVDFCSQKGPMISPDAFRRIVVPALRIVTDACHAHGVRFFYATDGNLWPVADDMFGEAGVDGYYEVDGRAGMDLRRLRERFPHVTLVGNIGSHTLHRGTRDHVVAETTSCLEAARDLGGIVVGVSNMIVPGTPPENIHAMLRTIEEGRRLSRATPEVLAPDVGK